MSLLTENNEKKLYGECETLLEAKKIIVDYFSNYKPNSNASKLDAYLSGIGDDMDNPFFMMKNNLKSSTKTIDVLYTIKKSQLLKLN